MEQNFLQTVLLILVLSLLSIGLIMVYSTSTVVAQMDPVTGNPYFFVKKQVIWMLFSGIGFLLCMSLHYRFWAKHSYTVFWLTILVLVLVLIPGIGVKYNGARRWIRMAGMGIQPSDLMKLAIILLIARYVEQQEERIRHFFLGFLPIFLCLALAFLLILLEPDFGTACFIFALGLTLLFVAGINWRHLLPMLALGSPLLLYLLLFKLQHIYARIIIYLNPGLDPLNKGYQIRQSLIALGSGGCFGQGLGWSQQKLFFLSEESTDFIFAILGEELGFLGTSSVLVLYILLMYYGIHIVRDAPDVFAKMVSLGITLMVGLQAMFNIAVVTHTIPAKGISLPFISFGGSGLFFMMCSMGILVGIAGHCQAKAPVEIQARGNAT